MVRLSSLLRAINCRSHLTKLISLMFISSLWDAEESTHYLGRVGDGVPGVVAVLFSPAEVAGLAVMSAKRLMVYEATYCKQKQSKELNQVLKRVRLNRMGGWVMGR